MRSAVPNVLSTAAISADFPHADRPFIAVFENLHWRRYDDAYRARFVSDLAATAEAAPDMRFVVKPHMGGQWFVRSGSSSSVAVQR